MGRIKQTVTNQMAIEILSNGNRSVVNILTRIVDVISIIDPDELINKTEKQVGLGILQTLDKYQLYGNKIIILYNKCNKRPDRFIAILKAIEFEIVTKETINRITKLRSPNLLNEQWNRIIRFVNRKSSNFLYS
jgi:hypothetical protein